MQNQPTRVVVIVVERAVNLELKFHCFTLRHMDLTREESGPWFVSAANV